MQIVENKRVSFMHFSSLYYLQIFFTIKDSCLPFSICDLSTAPSLIFILFTGPLFDLHVICRTHFLIYMLSTGSLFEFTCYFAGSHFWFTCYLQAPFLDLHVSIAAWLAELIGHQVCCVEGQGFEPQTRPTFGVLK